MSYFEHNEARRIPELIMRLRSGESVALTTDAGTPTISDPGYRLVSSAIDAGIRVTTVPGACAAIAALAVAGLPTDRFTFEGFLPSKTGEREKMLAQLATESRTMVIYEAARRLPRLLPELAAAFGPERRVAVIREATKTHEEIIRGSLEEVAQAFAHQPVLGEVTLVIEGAYGLSKAIPSLTLGHQEIIDVLRQAGLRLKDAAGAASKLTNISRRQIYQAAIKRQERRNGEP